MQLKMKEWKWVAPGSELSEVFCRLILDRPLENLSIRRENSDHFKISADEDKRMLKCLFIMLFYVRDLGAEGKGAAFSGCGLAVRPLPSGTIKMYSRIGLVEFRHLGGVSWETMKALMVTKNREAGEVAPSDNLSIDRFVITIV